jgi:hypothetical protein
MKRDTLQRRKLMPYVRYAVVHIAANIFPLSTMLIIAKNIHIDRILKNRQLDINNRQKI